MQMLSVNSSEESKKTHIRDCLRAILVDTSGIDNIVFNATRKGTKCIANHRNKPGGGTLKFGRSACGYYDYAMLLVGICIERETQVLTVVPASRPSLGDTRRQSKG